MGVHPKPFDSVSPNGAFLQKLFHRTAREMNVGGGELERRSTILWKDEKCVPFQSSLYKFKATRENVWALGWEEMTFGHYPWALSLIMHHGLCDG